MWIGIHIVINPTFSRPYRTEQSSKFARKHGWYPLTHPTISRSNHPGRRASVSCFCLDVSSIICHLNNVDLPGLEVHLQQTLEASWVVQPRDQRHQQFLDLANARFSPSRRPLSGHHSYFHYHCRDLPSCIAVFWRPLTASMERGRVRFTSSRVELSKKLPMVTTTRNNSRPIEHAPAVSSASWRCCGLFR